LAQGRTTLALGAPHSRRLRSIALRVARPSLDPVQFHSAANDGAGSLLLRPRRGRYTVDRYLDDLEKRYGGIDAVLVWSTYPNMGIDDRNQLEMVESMPGGVEGVRQMVADFHRRGVRVLFPMMMWDEGNAPTGPHHWPQAIAALMKHIDADGINGDTQDGVPLGFSLAAEKPSAIRSPLSPRAAPATKRSVGT
jgi:hypothetical protein